MDIVVTRPTEETVKSLVKVVAILEAFSASRRSLSLADIAAGWISTQHDAPPGGIDARGRPA
jgi:hypothetical protein